MSPSHQYTGISQKPKIQNKFCLFYLILSLVRFIYVPQKFDHSFLKFDCMGIFFLSGSFVPCLIDTFEMHFDFWLQSITVPWGTWYRCPSSWSVSGVLKGKGKILQGIQTWKENQCRTVINPSFICSFMGLHFTKNSNSWERTGHFNMLFS